ncbi:L,D-transpeptidase family protein [Microbacterium awajiense]|uniref:L,D-transpeptidase family protein n=1 Tax=Microbacterium awajiense TaxID=415214 RepID=A0ABP7AH78_9MICO
MTDLATKPSVDDDVVDDAASATPPTQSTGASPSDTGPGEPAYQWAPAEPARRKRRTGLWIGLGAGAAATALVASSLVLIAPGTSVAGVGVGLLTQGAAVEAIESRLADTTIILVGAGGDAEVTGADLGASVDSAALADEAFATHPMWNVTQWFPPSVAVDVAVDSETAAAALRDAAPAMYVDPVDATIAFDDATESYVVTDGVDGQGIDVEAVRTALQSAFIAGESTVTLDPVTAAVAPETQTYVADATAERLNRALDTVGFYVGSERVVPVDRAVAASWITLGDGPRGTFSIDVDSAAIQSVVDGLPDAVNRDAVNASVITDSDGGVLQTLTAGIEGRELGDTSGIADAFAAQLASADAVYELPVTSTEFTTSATARRLEVDLGEQRVYFFENGKLVSSSLVASGLPDTPTATGSFRIFAKVPMQDMGCFPGAPYCAKDIPWVSYFHGDIAFHGADYLDSFGAPRSHGCVNLPVSVAKQIYDWAPIGTEVWVHN